MKIDLSKMKRLDQFLADLSDPNHRSDDAGFVTAIENFIEIANLQDSEKIMLWGSMLSGLSYPYHDPKTGKDSYYQRDSWEIKIYPSSGMTYYHDDQNTNPAQGLIEFINGPTSIDCAMFNDLSILVGILYVLGHSKFNALFAEETLKISQNGLNKALKPYIIQNLDNMTPPSQFIIFRYIPNDFRYLKKHPRGNAMGHNCIVINGLMNIFDPAAEKNRNLTEEDVQNTLIAEFNKPSNRKDSYENLQITNETFTPFEIAGSGGGFNHTQLIRDVKQNAKNLFLSTLFRPAVAHRREPSFRHSCHF